MVFDEHLLVSFVNMARWRAISAGVACLQLLVAHAASASVARDVRHASPWEAMFTIPHLSSFASMSDASQRLRAVLQDSTAQVRHAAL